MTNNVSELRDEIARSIKAVRFSCFGRKCLKECQRRMAATAPHPRATRRRWGAAVAAVLLCLGACGLEGADIQCIWNGSTYVCSGSGNSIEVIGGGSGLPVVVTNFWGVCTNCVAMSPGDCERLKSDFFEQIGYIDSDLRAISYSENAVRSSISNLVGDISTFRRIRNFSQTGNASTSDWNSFTNYLLTVDNTQTALCKSLSGLWQAGNSATRGRYVMYNDGIYDYSQTVTSSLSSNLSYLDSLSYNVSSARESVYGLSQHLDSNLVCDQCQPDYSPGPDPGGGSGIATNGNWCTFDQGQAIKELLRDLKTWAERQHSQLVSISNFVEQSYNTMRDGLFTGYTHIPTEEDLGMHWQELYLEGYSPNFHEYSSTNILARIELLLAGMSGVLTNNSDFAESGDFAEGGMEATNSFKVAVSDFTNEVKNVIEQRERNVRSVGHSLIGLYEAFRGWSGTPFSRETLVNSYSVEIGEQHWDVPAFEPSENGLWVANLIRVVCRSVMTVFYILFTVVVFVRFHIAFFQWVYKYLKWGIELMQGLFA